MLPGKNTKNNLLDLTPEARRRFEALPPEERKRLEALARARQMQHSQGEPPRTEIVGLTKSYVPVRSQGAPIKETTDIKELDELLGLGGATGAGHAAKDPCGKRNKPINVEMLAEKVYERLLFEARIERERIGWELQ